MAEIQPFQGVLYNTERVRPADVLTQPYDKITPAMRERYLQSSPYNLIRIELGKDAPGDTDTNNKYSRARDLHRAWLRDGILRRSRQPAFYYLEQTFAAPDGSGTRTRKALIARVRLSRWDEGHILPHEHTLSKPKADRMALLRACGAQQGQIFMLYPQAVPSPQLGAPVMELTDDYQVTNKLYEISDPSAIRAIQSTIRPQQLYIADGHHRYETALAFRDECRAAAAQADLNAPHEFVMATLVDMSDPGLIILPTHRTVANLTGFDAGEFRRNVAQPFDLRPFESLAKMQAAMNDAKGVLGLCDAQGFALLSAKDPVAIRQLFENKPPLWHTLDVAILHVAILEELLGIDEVRLREEANVSYWREADKAVAEVTSGRAQLAFFLKPTPVGQVKAIADARSRMPQKSTDFYPKLLSGLVIHEVRPA